MGERGTNEKQTEKSRSVEPFRDFFAKLYMSPQLHFSDIEVDKASYQLVLLEMTEYAKYLRL